MDTEEDIRRMRWEDKYPPCEHIIDPASFRILANDEVKKSANIVLKWGEAYIGGATSALINCSECGAEAEIDLHTWLKDIMEVTDLDWSYS